MKIKFIILFGFFLSAITFQGQELESSLLWKISGNGLSSHSYLFGTLHATCNTKLKPRVLDALNKTKQLALEIDLSDTSMQVKMMQMMYIKDGKAVMDFVNEEDKQVLYSFLSENIKTINYEMLKRLKPFILQSMLVPTMLDCSLPQAYDMLLLHQAQLKKLPIIGLETIEDQMAIFDAIPIEEQITDLIKMAKDTNKLYERQFDELVKAYEDENLKELEKSFAKDKSLMSNYNFEILDNRNENWIPIIEKMCQDKPSFIGFGALHLIGEKGVIQLLRTKGYSVEAVMPE